MYITSIQIPLTKASYVAVIDVNISLSKNGPAHDACDRQQVKWKLLLEYEQKITNRTIIYNF
jgi:hypothetical protein